MSKTSKRAILTIIVIATLLTVMIPIMPASAAALTVAVTPTDLIAGALTDYEVDFTTVGEIVATTGTIIITFPVAAGEYDLSSLVLGDVSLTDDGGAYTPTSVVIAAGAGTVTITTNAAIVAGSVVIVTIANSHVKNPTSPAVYTIDVDTSAPDTGSDTVTIVLATGTLSITTTPVMGQASYGIVGPFDTPLSHVVDVGAYTVTFEILDTLIWYSPDPVNVVVTADTTTNVLGTYVLKSSTEFSIDYVEYEHVGYADYADILTVFGSGVTSGSTVELYWDFVTAASQLNTTTGLASGDFECEVKVPSAYFGDHYIWAKDLSTGLTTRSEAIPVVPKITLSPSSGLKGDEVTIKGYGFSEDSDVTITFPLQGGIPLSTDLDVVAETDELGYFEYKFKVSDLVTDATYDVDAKDPVATITSASFIVGAAITLDKEVGPAGTVVKVDGRGFNLDPLAIITIESITLENGDSYPVATKDEDDKNLEFSDGTFSVYIVIPSAPEGTYKVTFTDDGTTTKTASSEFEIDGETSITVTPEYGTPGTLLTVKGYNFTRISGTKIDLKLGERTAEATTDSSGSFTGTIVIPPSDLGKKYPVIANDTIRFVNAEDDVLVTIIFLQLSDLSAPVGSDVILMGSGFTSGTEGGKWNATFGDLDLIETLPISTGQTYFSKTFYVPSLPSGTYPIGVYDVEREITVFIDFTITEQAALSVSRAAIPNKYNLTIKGKNFVELAGQDTQWWIFNSTDAWDLNLETNVTYGGDVIPKTSSEEDEEGTFTGYYKIPEFLELGSYTINCTTVSNAPTGEDWEIIQTAEVDIEIVPEELLIHIGSPSYARGQTITFVIKTTLKKEPFHLGIKDPEGSEYFNTTWNAEEDADDSWKTLGTWFYIPSNLQVDKNTAWLYTLPTDATPGTWTYSFWDDDKEYANGTFQVTYLTELEQLREDIGGLVDDVEGIGTSVDDLGTTVAGVSGAAAEAAAAAATAAAAAANAQTAAEAATTAVENVGEIATDALDAANNAVSAADAAKAAADAGLDAANAAQTTSQAAADAAQDAADAADDNRSATSGLTTLVYGAIGASLIAALAAIVSLMQISRRIAG